MVGFGKVVDAVEGRRRRHVVGAGRFDRSAFAAEFGNVGARHEGLAAGAGQDDDAHVVVDCETIEDGLGRLHMSSDTALCRSGF